MLPHSLTQLWRRPEVPSTISKKQGKPEIQWSPSQERKLFRLVEDGVPWKHIPTCIKEAQFSPSKGTCRTHWKKMTDMDPSKIPISNPLSRKKHREQRLKAFEAYQQANTIVDLPTPGLTIDGTTPADLGSSIATPRSHDGHHHIGADIKCTSSTTTSTEQLKSPNLEEITSNHGVKRHGPAEFDEEVCFPPAKQETLPSRSQSTSDLVTITQFVPGHRANTEVYVPKAEDSISAVEDEMKVPHGYIDWLKRLTKSRWSIQSLISDSSTPIPPLPNANLRDIYSHPATDFRLDSSNTQNASKHPAPLAQSISNDVLVNLFTQLRIQDLSDDTVAQHVENLLVGYDPEEIMRIVRTRNTKNETLLEVALALGNVPACETLLQHGADVKALTSTGTTLRMFGRRAMGNATTNQQYVAIGICRNVISSHLHETADENRFNIPRRWTKRTRGGHVSGQGGHAPSSVGFLRLLRRSVTTASTVLPGHRPQHRFQSSTRVSDVQSGPMNGNHPEFRVDSNNKEGVPLPTPSIPQDPVLEDYATTHTRASQLVDREVPTLLSLPGFDPRFGYFEILHDNRKAFILHPHIDPTLFIPIDHTVPASNSVSSRMNNFHAPSSDGWIGAARDTSMATRRHGVVFEPDARESHAQIPPPNSRHRGIPYSDSVMSMYHTSMSMPANIHHMSYHSQADTLNHTEIGSELSNTIPQPNAQPDESHMANTFEFDVEDILFGGNLA